MGGYEQLISLRITDNGKWSPFDGLSKDYLPYVLLCYLLMYIVRCKNKSTNADESIQHREVARK